GDGIAWPLLARESGPDGLAYRHVRVEYDRARRRATLTVRGPGDLPGELDDAILHLRFNEPELGILVLRSEGDPAAVLAVDALLDAHRGDWLVREITLLLKRVLKRLDLTARSLFALAEPGHCFAGSLAELLFAADRALIFAGTTLTLSRFNFGAYPM